MSQAIHRLTKEIRDSMDTATAGPEWLLYHKRTIPADVRAMPPHYRVIDGENVRVATEAERVAIDAERASAEAAAVAAALAERRTRAKAMLALLDTDCGILIRAAVAYLVKRDNETRIQPTKAFPALTAADVRIGIMAEVDALNGT